MLARVLPLEAELSVHVGGKQSVPAIPTSKHPRLLWLMIVDETRSESLEGIHHGDVNGILDTTFAVSSLI